MTVATVNHRMPLLKMLAIGLAAATIALPAPTTAAGQGSKKSKKDDTRCFKLEGHNPNRDPEDGSTDRGDPTDPDYGIPRCEKWCAGHTASLDTKCNGWPLDKPCRTCAFCFVGNSCEEDDDCLPSEGIVCTRDDVCKQGVDVTCALNPDYPHGNVPDEYCKQSCFTFDLAKNSANADSMLEPADSDFNDACFIQDRDDPDPIPNTIKPCQCLGTFPPFAPSMSPSSSPSDAPSDAPSSSPSDAPSDAPSSSPSGSTYPSDAPSDAPSMHPTAPPSDYPEGTKSILLRYCLPCDKATELTSGQIPSCASQYGVFEKDTSVKGCGKYDTGTNYFAGPYVYPGFCSKWQYACSKTVAVLSKVVDSNVTGVDRLIGDGTDGARDLFAAPSIAGDCPGDIELSPSNQRSCRLWFELVFAPETPNKQVASIASQFRKDKRYDDLTITKANTKDGNCPETKLSAVQNLGAYDVVLVTGIDIPDKTTKKSKSDKSMGSSKPETDKTKKDKSGKKGKASKEGKKKHAKLSMGNSPQNFEASAAQLGRKPTVVMGIVVLAIGCAITVMSLVHIRKQATPSDRAPAVVDESSSLVENAAECDTPALLEEPTVLV